MYKMGQDREIIIINNEYEIGATGSKSAINISTGSRNMPTLAVV